MSSRSLAGRRVLLAEDGADNQHLLSLHLRGAGMEVEVVDNGQSAADLALAACREGAPYNLILMDMQMPQCDGYSATRLLRERKYAGRIVALTAHAMEGDRARCLAAGCDDYLSKPVGRLDLLRCVAVNIAVEGGDADPSSASPPVVTGTTTPIGVSSGGNRHEDRPAPLVSTFEGDPQMAEVIDRFVGRLHARVATLERAAREGDRTTLVREAHQIKGAAASFGFGPVTDAAAAFESKLHEGGNGEVDLAALRELVGLCRRASAPASLFNAPNFNASKEHATAGSGD